MIMSSLNNFNQNAQNNDYIDLENGFEDIQRFMDARDYSDHSYDIQIENNNDLCNNRESIREFMAVEVNNGKNQQG